MPAFSKITHFKSLITIVEKFVVESDKLLSSKISRFDFIKYFPCARLKFLLILIGIILTLGIYSVFIEPNKLEITNYTIQDESLQGIKIVFASDFHIKPNQQKRLEKIVELINLQNPDLVLSAGDFVCGVSAPQGGIETYGCASYIQENECPDDFVGCIARFCFKHGHRAVAQSVARCGNGCIG